MSVDKLEAESDTSSLVGDCNPDHSYKSHQLDTSPESASLATMPIRLSCDNFTPLSRTPWAGSKIFPTFKSKLLDAEESEVKIGESWEFSCDPDFPSLITSSNELVLTETPMTLADLVKQRPEQILSADLIQATGHRDCEILLKILNADSPLSVQVHPDDSNPSLKPHECGKPESWLVLEADPGAGLYLGFSQNISLKDLKKAFANETVQTERVGDCVSEAQTLLQFVPVVEGDYFEIDPGVVHAVGPGVTLLEPQRILFGKSGKTYRLWDWGRKYDAAGNIDFVAGTSRELHLEEAMMIVRPESQVGAEFISRIKKSATVTKVGCGGEIKAFPRNNHYQVLIIHVPTGRKMSLELLGGYGAMFCLEGQAELSSKSSRKILFSKGEPGLLPHAASPILIEAKTATDIAIVVPSVTSYLAKMIE